MVSQISKHNENINSGDISPTVQPHLSLEDTSLGPGGGPPHENERMSPKRNHFQKEKIFHSLIFIGDDDVYMLVFNWSYSKATTFGTPPRSPNWRKKTGEKKCKKIWVPLFKKRLPSSDFCHLRLRQRNFVQTAGAKVQAQPAKRVIAQRCFAREQGIDRGHLEHQGLGFKNLKVHRFALGSLYFQSSDFISQL